MPSHSVKQAKVMSAIAHGWKPKGSVAKIPVKVANEFHAADAGHKYGKGHHQKKADGGEVDDDKPSLLTPDIGGALPEATVDFNKPLPGHLVQGIVNPIKQAIDTSTEDVQHLGE